MRTTPGDDAQLSEDDYWAWIRAYNADGTYAFPPAPVSADQVLDFWLRVPVPDDVPEQVQWRDEARHRAAEQALHVLHTHRREMFVKSALHRDKWIVLPPLSPAALQKDVDNLARQHRYRKRPELLAQTERAKMLAQAIAETEQMCSSVPPQRIPLEDIRMAARLGHLHVNAQRLSRSEFLSLYATEVIVMGRRQRLIDVWRAWRPDLIV
ncbi:MAG: hypothetical protein ACYCTE_14730 [Acidimicrobiales bacterium]